MNLPKIIKEKSKSEANNFVISGKKLTIKEFDKLIIAAENTKLLTLEDFNNKCEKLKNSI